MRTWYITSAALLAFVVGCNMSSEGGAPGTHATFKLSLPVSIMKDVKQGNTQSFDATMERGSEFKHDVKLSVANNPEKIDVKLSKEMIKATDGDTKFTITVSPAKDASVGEHEIKITGTPDSGQPTTGSFKIKVVENKP
jgi:hypothetical protein